MTIILTEAFFMNYLALYNNILAEIKIAVTQGVSDKKSVKTCTIPGMTHM